MSSFAESSEHVSYEGRQLIQILYCLVYYVDVVTNGFICLAQIDCDKKETLETRLFDLSALQIISI